jgi:hypothetical protein
MIWTGIEKKHTSPKVTVEMGRACELGGAQWAML